MSSESFYVLVQGKYYLGDIEGKRYHWIKGIPGSKQLYDDISEGKKVVFVYYRTWDKDIKRGKYFYGAGEFVNNKMDVTQGEDSIEYFAEISNYKQFASPVYVHEDLRKKVWPGANRQAGIKRISESLFNRIINPGLKPTRLKGLASLVGEQNLENLLNGQIIPTDLNDSESIDTTKRTIETEVYRRTRKVIIRLKRRYNGICQITGEKLLSFTNIGVDVTEAHHIQYLCNEGAESDLTNIIIISPEWHRVIHKQNPHFNRHKLEFVFADGKTLPIHHPGHLIN
jgi:hypothetical protein